MRSNIGVHILPRVGDRHFPQPVLQSVRVRPYAVHALRIEVTRFSEFHAPIDVFPQQISGLSPIRFRQEVRSVPSGADGHGFVAHERPFRGIASATMLNVNASMNAANPRVAPAMAETGDSFSSSDRRCMACPSRYPNSIATITATIVPAKTAQMGMTSNCIGSHPRLNCAVNSRIRHHQDAIEIYVIFFGARTANASDLISGAIPSSSPGQQPPSHLGGAPPQR